MKEGLETKVQALVKEIIEKTRVGEIAWDRQPFTDGIGSPNQTVTLVFESQYRGKTLRIFHYNYKSYPFNEVDFVWDASVSMQIVGTDGEAIWDFPEMHELWELFEAIRFKVGGIEELLAEAN